MLFLAPAEALSESDACLPAPEITMPHGDHIRSIPEKKLPRPPLAAMVELAKGFEPPTC